MRRCNGGLHKKEVSDGVIAPGYEREALEILRKSVIAVTPCFRLMKTTFRI